MATRLPKPEFSREHRLGLVVYGGVSLAIYMNGICREFYNAVQGLGIYKLIKALTDADIIVDIISGTSAGGINGVLLAYALANSSEEFRVPFDEFAKIWIESGDIKKLLFSPKYDGHYKTSFLDGANYYRSQLKQALLERKKVETSRSDWVSSSENLDLFVTGTDLLGRIYETFDNTGRIIEVKDHRSIFHLKYREAGENAFGYRDQTACGALAKLCQITSCFPAAFPPVTVYIGGDDPFKSPLKPDDKTPSSQKQVDETLIQWGKLRKNRRLPKLLVRQRQSLPWDDRNPRQQEIRREIDDDLGKGYRLHFADGGVLDNRPFSYAIETIYNRTAERRVFRKLFYVDPSPDRFLDNTRYRRMMKPDLLQVVTDSISALPRYESINNDLELIKQHNEKVRRYKFLLADIEALLDKEQSDNQNRDLRDQQVYVYQRARLLKLKDKLVSRVYLESEDCLQDLQDEEARDQKSQQETPQNANHRSADKKLSDSLRTLTEELTASLDVDPDLSDSLDSAYKQVNCLLNLDQQQKARRDLDKAVELLTKPLEPDENAQWVKLLEVIHQETDGLDIEYSLRKHFFIVDYIQDLLESEDLCRWFIQKIGDGKDSPKVNDKDAPQVNGKNDLQKIKSVLDLLISPTKSACLETEQTLKAKMLQELRAKMLQELVNALKQLIKDINQCIQCIQGINEDLEQFFSSKEVSNYFKTLIQGLDDLESKDKFPTRFYQAMCAFHKHLLCFPTPENSLKDLKIPEALRDKLNKTRKTISERVENNEFLGKKVPGLEHLSLNEIVQEIDATESSEQPEECRKSYLDRASLNQLTILQIVSYLVSNAIGARLLTLPQDRELREQVEQGCEFENEWKVLRGFLSSQLKKYFDNFKKLDEFLFPLDYLAGISEKQLIETYRISPEDARYGLSSFIARGKRLEEKLTGDTLGAFAGFLKQSWRENDILWGRLDGLDRIVESLVTDDQVKKFPDFWERQAEEFASGKNLNKADAKARYLDSLLNEALEIDPCDLDPVKQELKHDLKEKIEALNRALTANNALEQGDPKEITRCRTMLVQALVRAGHLLILQQESPKIEALGKALSKPPHRKYDTSREDKRMETAFRDHYKVGLEGLQDIPKADWNEIKARMIAIAKDIIYTYQHKRYKRFEPKLLQNLGKERKTAPTASPLVTHILRFLLLLFVVVIPLIANLLIFILPLIAIVSVLLVSSGFAYFSLKIFLKPRQFKQLKLKVFKYFLSLENVFFQVSTPIAIWAVVKVFVPMIMTWKNRLNARKDPLEVLRQKRRGRAIVRTGRR